eukprot:gnl/TRDRNA2_/TRDRNA2_83773_c0_seq1.p2 gnl/TRDRNA2_/TRDRNA2_83773_c0~~gnl/TRDRNA2_/TRDRNA2_83773_c0_seq1.p2  ORF type:complete len:267 (+),score=58.11 gnl/TRDRNA2_/TRDRNA2_83773_c0_seq1:85-885(+)
MIPAAPARRRPVPEVESCRDAEADVGRKVDSSCHAEAGVERKVDSSCDAEADVEREDAMAVAIDPVAEAVANEHAMSDADTVASEEPTDAMAEAPSASKEGTEDQVANGAEETEENWDDEELQRGLALYDLLAEGKGSGVARERPSVAAVRADPAAEETPAGEDEAPRCVGTVEKFAGKRGFGLIVPDVGTDRVFAHWTQIVSGDQWPQLSAGVRVEYTPERENGKLVAKRITGLDGNPIVAIEDVERRFRQLSPFVVSGRVAFFS